MVAVEVSLGVMVAASLVVVAATVIMVVLVLLLIPRGWLMDGGGDAKDGGIGYGNDTIRVVKGSSNGEW